LLNHEKFFHIYKLLQDELFWYSSFHLPHNALKLWSVYSVFCLGPSKFISHTQDTVRQGKDKEEKKKKREH